MYKKGAWVSVRVVMKAADYAYHGDSLMPPPTMVLFPSLVSAACLLAPGAVARLLGPMDPAPVDLASSNSAVHAAWKNITAELDALVGDELQGLGNYTFSVGLFSMHDAAAQAAYQYHHTGPDVAQSDVGVTSVDGDSIYRVASISKLVTALVGNLRLNASEWNRPLTDIFPEIADLPVAGDALEQVQWQEITPLALATQLTGLVSNGYPFAADYAASGLATPCTDTQQVECSARDYIAGLNAVHRPNFRPWTTSQYSNTNFVLLGLVLRRLTGQDLAALYRDAVFAPLGMARSSAAAPPADAAPFAGYVVAGDAAAFRLEGGITAGSGGVYSTTNDLARLGVGILNGALLGGAATRRWLRPVALTAAADFAVGAGWEIYRYAHADGTGAVTELYTKSGNSGAYSGYAVLAPAHGAGFSLLLASGVPGTAGPALLRAQARAADAVTAALLPALQRQAAAEAARRFAGTYAAADGAAALTLVYNATATPGAGLRVAAFAAGGVDVLVDVYGGRPVLQPAIDDRRRGGGDDDGGPAAGGRLSFQATAVGSAWPAAAVTGLFSRVLAENLAWFDTQELRGQSIRTFEFDLGPDGRATAVTVPALGVTLERVDE